MRKIFLTPLCTLTILCAFTSGIMYSQSLPISIDGEFSDWDAAYVLYIQDSTAAAPAGLHPVRVQVSNDDRFLFLKFELDREITLLENNPLVLLINTDNDINTGYDAGNTGAELRWVFGNRQGTFYSDTGVHSILYHHIRLRTAPTVSSTVFEIAIGRDTRPDTSNPLFQSDTIAAYFHSLEGNLSVSGTYIFDPLPVAPPEPIPLERTDDSDLRILAFNAWSDKLFNAQFTNQYRRILGALDPDIIAFQEIWDHDAFQTAQRVEELLPSAGSFQWHAVKNDMGNVTVSRYPVLDSRQIPVWNGFSFSDQHRLTAALIDTRNTYNTNFVLVNIHLRCCSGGENNRWNEITSLKNFIHDTIESGGPLNIDEGTPIVLAGDFNLVGSSGQLAAIETDINEWDGSAFNRVHARQTEKRMHYTWRNDGGAFSPGKLDYIFYTGSVMSLKNSFTLQVEEMSQIQREKYGLEYGDTESASDHLPHVADFGVHQATSTEETGTPNGYSLGYNYPNPFNPSTTITFSLAEPGDVKIDVYDILGRHITELVNDLYSGGMHNVTYDASALSGGMYVIRMETGSHLFTGKMTLLK
jgi:endonuclease/exonuclease/phosphatase family metal-dependent hydrolase